MENANINLTGKGLDEKYCSSCGNIIKQLAEICPKCGVRQINKIFKVKKSDLLLLTFFLGGFGAHKFYLKKNVQGIIYLLFFWTFIPVIIAAIEFFVYIFTSEEVLNAKYGLSD